jgi:hypothetical protein
MSQGDVAEDLSDSKRKTLLEDLEAGGGRHLVLFKTVCDENPGFYGAIKDPKRRKFQVCNRLN